MYRPHLSQTLCSGACRQQGRHWSRLQKTELLNPYSSPQQDRTPLSSPRPTLSLFIPHSYPGLLEHPTPLPASQALPMLLPLPECFPLALPVSPLQGSPLQSPQLMQLSHYPDMLQSTLYLLENFSSLRQKCLNVCLSV